MCRRHACVSARRSAASRPAAVPSSSSPSYRSLRRPARTGPQRSPAGSVLPVVLSQTVAQGTTLRLIQRHGAHGLHGQNAARLIQQRLILLQAARSHAECGFPAQYLQKIQHINVHARAERLVQHGQAFFPRHRGVLHQLQVAGRLAESVRRRVRPSSTASSQCSSAASAYSAPPYPFRLPS